MSAATQNCAYVFGKKVDNRQENVMSEKKLDEIKASVEKYFQGDKKKK